MILNNLHIHTREVNNSGQLGYYINDARQELEFAPSGKPEGWIEDRLQVKIDERPHGHRDYKRHHQENKPEHPAGFRQVAVVTIQIQAGHRHQENKKGQQAIGTFVNGTAKQEYAQDKSLQGTQQDNDI
jgi:hypothetical protein